MFELDSEIKAEFAELLSRQKTYQVKIPRSEKIIGQIFDNYQAYKEGLKTLLEGNAHEKTHDWAKAEQIANEILVEYGLIT